MFVYTKISPVYWICQQNLCPLQYIWLVMLKKDLHLWLMNSDTSQGCKTQNRAFGRDVYNIVDKVLYSTCTRANPSFHIAHIVDYVRLHWWYKPGGRVQLKWCFVAIIFDFLATVKGVRDQLLHHLRCELPIADVEAEISIHRTPHILNKTTSIHCNG